MTHISNRATAAVPSLRALVSLEAIPLTYPSPIHSGVACTPTVSASRLLHDKEAAQMLGVSPATMRSWRCRGVGPDFVKMGFGKKSPVRYSVADIEAFITQCRQVPLVRAALEN